MMMISSESQNIYWLFSSSAQAISAFIAFLITGFALVQTMMDSISEKDDSLEEIHAKLKTEYYKTIKRLSIVTGFAILLSLLMVYLNGIDIEYKVYLFVFTSIFNVLSIVGGILFVISIIDPNKYKKVANELIKNRQKEFGASGKEVNQSEFTRKFIMLELLVRILLTRKRLVPSKSTGSQKPISFRAMAEILMNSEIIDKDFFAELLQISNYRNLVFHGHVTQVDEAMVDRVNSAVTRVRRIK
jgi:uncharacterized membrane protein